MITNVDVDETFKNGGIMCNVYEGFVYRKNFEISPFKKVIVYLINLKVKYEDEANNLIVDLMKLTMNSLY